MLKYEKPLLLDLEDVAAAAECCDTGGGSCGGTEVEQVEVAV